MPDIPAQIVTAVATLGGAILGMAAVLISNASKNRHDRKMEEVKAKRELAQKRSDETFGIYSEFASAAARVLDAQRAFVAASIHQRDDYDRVFPQIKDDIKAAIVGLSEAQAKILLRGSETAKIRSAEVVDLLQTMTPYRGGSPLDVGSVGEAADVSIEASKRLGAFLEECAKEFQDPS